jgi:S-formylglutathione hydrolase FrmB
MKESGRVSRRTLLMGAAGTVAVLGGGDEPATTEIDTHPSLRQRLFGCGSTPSLPPKGSYQTNILPVRSKAMGRVVPVAISLPDGHFYDLPLIVALPGEGAALYDVAYRIGLPNYANQAGMPACILSPGGVGSSYYHPRTDGTDMLAFVVDELVPYAEESLAYIGGSQAKRAIYGYSMGGFGALLIAQQRPDLFCAAVATSPAVFPSYDAAITGHPHTFDSQADWERYGVWEHLSQMGSVPIRIDCGNADPFAPTARRVLGSIKGAVGSIDDGCHDIGFWRRQAPREMAFLKAHLSAVHDFQS